MIFKRILLFILFLFFLTGCSNSYVDIDGERIFVEIADSTKEREKGLQSRENLCDSCGMLFVFEEEGNYGFWMKDTLIPLDMIFINSDGVVVKLRHAVPCFADSCEIYSSEEPAMYVLETNVNKFNEEIIGEKIRIAV
tara:strand:- start:1958 stop:2371 length:414 start_codon:yes stop_codon:yes gene_type:complete